MHVEAAGGLTAFGVGSACKEQHGVGSESDASCGKHLQKHTTTTLKLKACGRGRTFLNVVALEDLGFGTPGLRLLGRWLRVLLLFVLDYNLDRFTELKAVVGYGSGCFFLPYLNVVPLGSAVPRPQWLCFHCCWTAATSARGSVVAYSGGPLQQRRLRALRLPPVLQRGVLLAVTPGVARSRRSTSAT